MTPLAVTWWNDVLIAAGAVAVVGAAIGYLTGWGRSVARAAFVLRQRRALRQPSSPEIPKPSPDQVRILDAVYESFRTRGGPVGFSELDKQLDFEGLKLRTLAESMPPGLLIPDVSSRGGFFRDNDTLMVSLNGLAYCEHGAEALDLLARGLAYIAKREKPWIPTPTEPHLKITGAEIRKELHLSDRQIVQLRCMLETYEGQARTTATWSEETGVWDMTVAPEYVRGFRGVRGGDQYLRARAGESFEHQLDEEESIVRFTLTCEIPSSLALDTEPVVMRVENHGPSDTFEATITQITGALRPATPWNIRWRGITDQGKEILAGGHWMLEIACDDALHGASENNWTPGFLFLQPSDSEVFVAPNGLGSTGARYGVSMCATVRVTPRSQPRRALENTVTLQLTEQGRHVLWDRYQVPGG